MVDLPLSTRSPFRGDMLRQTLRMDELQTPVRRSGGGDETTAHGSRSGRRTTAQPVPSPGPPRPCLPQVDQVPLIATIPRMRIAWIGLGTMGHFMAAHLLEAGHGLTVHNRTAAKADGLVSLGAARAVSPAEAAAGADLVFTCVSDSADVQDVVLGHDGAASRMRPGSVLIDCSTIAPAVTRHIAEELGPRGIGVVDAPVSGGSEGARKGTLTAFVGGEVAHVATAGPALEAFCTSITHLGGPGAGQAAKAVNQVLVAGTYAALAEALVLGEREGLPMTDLVTALSAGAAQSWVLENRSDNVIRGEYPLGFRVALHLKDLRIALAEADELGIDLPLTDLIAAQERRLVEAGFGDEDLSNLARVPRGLEPGT